MKFHERFEIDTGIGEARRRFVNRIFNELFEQAAEQIAPIQTDERYYLMRHVATALGERHEPYQSFNGLVEKDFHKCLHAVEAMYSFCNIRQRQDIARAISARIDWLITQSEVNLQISWSDGEFRRQGAPVLDEALVNVPLRWLKNRRFEGAYGPLEKALRHLLDAGNREELTSDVVTDAYECLEGLAKAICENNKDLSANLEKFLAEIKASSGYKAVVKEYIAYGNKFRHAVDLGSEKPKIKLNEAESFVYLTGAIVRLAMD